MKLPQTHRLLLDATLTKILGANTSYLFSYCDGLQSGSVFPNFKKSTGNHYYILAFSDKTYDNLTNTLADFIARQSGNAFTATVVLHKPKHLKARSADMSWFFDQILTNGFLIGDESERLFPSESLDAPQRDFPAARAFWYKCEAVASVYFQAAWESPQLDVELVKVSLLAQAAEYMLLGLIRIFLGYTPIQHNLKFLFALCAHFTDLHQKAFALETEMGKRVFRQLCAPPTMLRQWDRLEMPEDDFDFLISACAKFIEGARKLALYELEKQISNEKITLS